MTEEDPDLLAGDNLDRLRGRNPHTAMSERFRLWEELENAKYQNNLLAQRCRELEQERDEARQEICIQKCDSLGALIGGSPETPQDYAKERGWDCFKENTND
jgi:hypothetical protein